MHSSSSYPRRTTQPPDTPSFGERYELIRKLGAGGMGAVYQAVDSALEKNVAVKILLPGLSADTIIRFQQEARATARLDHPNIVKVLDFGQTPNGDLFLIMDYVGKSSLEDLIKREKRIPIEKALPIFIQIASGLTHAHKNGILHRDVKPSNIMLSETQDGNVQLVDFGLAKLEEGNQKLTTTGIHVGSPLYMSPEQVSGIDVDVRSDIYSLGCLMFKTLTGKPPLQGKTAIDTIMMQREQIPPLLSETDCGLEFSSEIEDIVAKTLEKDPADRFQSAEELKQALEGFRDLHKARQALAASFAHNFDERLNPSNKKQTVSIDEVIRSSRAMLVKHRIGILVSAIVLVSAGYLMHYQFMRMSSSHAVATKISEHTAHELMNVASAQVIERGRAPGEKINKASGFGQSFGEIPHKKNWDEVPQYSKQHARQMLDEIQSTPSLSHFAKDPALRHAILSGKLHRLWHTHSMSGLLHGKLMEELMPSMQAVWSEPKYALCWQDPVVQEFLRTPKLWKLSTKEKQSPALSKFSNSQNLAALMADERFLAMLRNPKFMKLMLDKRFQILLSDPVNMKMMQCMEAYRDQMKNDVADVIFPLQDDLAQSK